MRTMATISKLKFGISVVCLFAGSLNNAFADTVTIGATTGTTNSYYFGPIYRSGATSTFNYSRYAHLYTAAELLIPAGATISNIEWLQYNSGTISGSNVFDIWLGNTTTATLVTATPWTTLTGMATQVYGSTAQSFMGAAGYWHSFAVTPFTYTGDNLLILANHQKLGTASGSVTWYTNSSSGKAIGSAASTAPTTLNTTTYGNTRPTIRITWSGGSACTEPAEGGTASISGAINCSGAFSVSISGYSSGSGVTFQWQDSPDGSSWNDIPGATSASYAGTQSSDTYYQCNVTCGSSTNPSTSVFVQMLVPAGGTTASTFTSVCPSASFTLSVTGASSLTGQTYQWQSSPDGTTWSNISGATSTTRVQTQTSDTYYRRGTICGTTDYSTSILISMESNFYNCYCANNATNTGDEEIYSLTVNGVTNARDCATVAPGPGSALNKYSNFRTLGAMWAINQGATVNFTVQEDECPINATYYPFGTAMWIDYNQDGDFDDPGEQVFTETTTALGPRNVVSSFVVPAGATLGVTGLRVLVKELSPAGSAFTVPACGTYSYGETEDYLVNIIGPLASSPPDIAHTALTNTSSSSARTVSADITDVDGDLDTNSGSEPTVWWRTGTSGAFSSVPMTTPAPGSSSKENNKLSATFEADIPGQSVPGTIVQYYIAAQDLDGNVTTNPSGGSGTTPPGSTDPGIKNYYTIYQLNDNCADAALIDWTDPIIGSNVLSTQDTGMDQSCASQSSTNKSVWYGFAVPSGETWEVQFNNEGGTTYNSAMELFSGACGALTTIECDDNGGVSPSTGAWIPSTTDGPPPTNPFGEYRTLTPNSYLLLVSGSGTASGTFQLNSYRNIILDPVTNGGNPLPDGIQPIGSTEGGISVTLSGGGSNPTSISGEISPGTPNGTFNNGVQRGWSINIVGGNGPITLRFTFLQSEMPPGMFVGGTAEVWIRVAGVWTSIGTAIVADAGGGYAYVDITYGLSSPLNDKYTNLLNDLSGDVGIGNVGDTPLYVNLASFEAKQENKDIVLRWTTASEVDNKGFIVYGGKKVIDAKDDTERIAYIELGNYKNTASLVGKSSSTLETKYSFVDLREHNIGEDYYYYIADEDKDGTVTQHTEFTSKVTYKSTAETQTQFASYELKQNHPNPFNPETTIEFTISKTQNVEVSVYNVNGQLVKTLVNGTLEGNAVGTSHKVIWDGTDASGNIVSSGIYFYQIKAGNFVQTKKATFLK